MDRRAFLTSFHSPKTPIPEPASRLLPTGLEPYVPSAASPWDAVRVGHLLRRTTMLPKWSEIAELMEKTPSEAVDLLLNTASNPVRPAVADSATENLEGLDVIEVGRITGQWKTDAGTLRQWWIDTLINSPRSIVEKMTFFWSGHFTTQFALGENEYVQAPLLYRQNTFLRALSLGNFRDMSLGITIDGAMLVFLGGDLNNKSHANENYARELMELYTIGLGHYSEGDVREAARILTGWHASRFNNQFYPPSGLFNSYFTPKDHDQGSKQFLNVSFSAIGDATNTEDLVKKNEIEKMIDTIFTERRQEAAIFISRKIYRYFVYSSPDGLDEKVIADMAKILTDNNFEIKPLITTLLKSTHFFDNANIGAQIKTPAEYVIGFARQFNYTTGVDGNMSAMLQQLFQPPDVSGWSGWHDWITTSTFPVRSKLAANALSAMPDSAVLDFINSFSNPSDAKQLVKDVCALLLPRPLSKGRQDDFVNRLVGGDGASKDYEWPGILSGAPTTAVRNMRDLLTTLVELPDFQLC